MMRYLAILLVWFACYFIPQYFGPWYDAYFNVGQSAISVLLLFSVLKLSSEWWTKEFGAVVVLQILFNIGDYIFDFPAENYNNILTVLNGLELAIIVVLGGLTQCYKGWRNGNSGSAGPHTGDSRISAPKGIHQRNGNA